MIKLLTIAFLFPLLISCTSNKKLKTVNETTPAKGMPACIESIINSMSSETNGSPQSVTRYTFNNQTVYYLVSPCCDKYNIVYDSACNTLGYPDGGFTGKGDGKMSDFKTDATNGKIVWKKDSK